jgi:hypothetical protein
MRDEQHLNTLFVAPTKLCGNGKMIAAAARLIAWMRKHLASLELTNQFGRGFIVGHAAVDEAARQSGR